MKHKIAIIEDDHTIAQMYRYKFEAIGHEVQTAHDGQSGYELVRSFRPDLLLLDIRMPEMNGDEMLKKVREQEWGGDVRVIILTNISRDEAPSIFRFLNVDRYIVKAHHTPAQVTEIAHEVLGVR
jgi:two-component system phosphate regulon response regulator PhoB